MKETRPKLARKANVTYKLNGIYNLMIQVFRTRSISRTFGIVYPSRRLFI